MASHRQQQQKNSKHKIIEVTVFDRDDAVLLNILS